MSKILAKMSATVAYELIEGDHENSYGIRSYFENGARKTTEAMAVTVENVTGDLDNARKVFEYLVRVCALPYQLPEMIQDIKSEC